jgi:hypothetical protein
MKPVYVLLCCFLAGAPALRAQVETYHLNLPRKPLAEASSPFGSVEVIDNRLDTARLYTIESGDYPPLAVSFDTSLQVAAQTYMTSALATVKRGDARLLVRIDRLSTANVDLRIFFTCHASVYVQQTDGTYKPLFRVKKVYRNMRNGPSHIVAGIFSQILDIAGAVYTHRPIKDTVSFVVSPPGPALTLAQIRSDPRDRWRTYAILQPIPLVPGVYPTFSDFRGNRVARMPVLMMFNPKDSLYTPSGVHGHPWGICDGQNMYMRLRGDRYILLDREPDGVYFYVPWSTPDMYALLTRSGDLHYEPETAVHVAAGGYVPVFIPPAGHKGGGGGSGVNAGQAALIAGGLIVVGITVALIVQSAQKHAAIRRGLQGDYRFCTVDMDSGDLLYSSEDYPFRPMQY